MGLTAHRPRSISEVGLFPPAHRRVTPNDFRHHRVTSSTAFSLLSLLGDTLTSSSICTQGGLSRHVKTLLFWLMAAYAPSSCRCATLLTGVLLRLLKQVGVSEYNSTQEIDISSTF